MRDGHRRGSLDIRMQCSSVQNPNNFHKNFRDFSKSSQENREQVAKARGKILLKQFGKRLRSQVEEKAKQKFQDEVQNGMRLSYQEIKGLRPDWKKVYESQIISEDSKI